MLGLCVGPALYAVPHWRRWDRVLDAFTLTAVGGLSLLHLVPEAVEHAGWMAIPFTIGGALLPRLVQSLRGVGPWLLLLGLIGHALLEAAAMATPSDHSAFGLAVVLHRIPVGLAVFATYHEHPRTHGMGWVAIGLLMAATVVGFFAGQELLVTAGGTLQAAVEALVAGMLLHVVWEHGSHDHDHDSGSAHEDPLEPASGGGATVAVAAALGLAVVIGFSWGGNDHGAPVGPALVDIAAFFAPAFLLVGALSAAAIAMRPPGTLAGFVPAAETLLMQLATPALLGVWLAAMLGITLPAPSVVHYALLVACAGLYGAVIVRHGPRTVATGGPG